MLKSKSLFPHDRPVYREVIPQALNIAWKNPVFWLFGIFAAVLNTSGSVDVFWKFFNSIQTQGSDMFIGNAALRFWLTAQATGGGTSWLPYLQGILALAFFFVVIIAFIVASCIGQGAIINSIGNWKVDKRGGFKKSLWVGARAIFPILVLNILVIVSIWVARFFVSLPLAMALGPNHPAYMAVYVVSFIVFCLLALVLSIMQVYALNAMILQGATLVQAFPRAWQLFKRHWLVTLETAVLQAVIVGLIGMATTVIGLVLSFPTVILYLLALSTANLLLFQISIGIFFAVLLIFLLVALGFTVTFQYALWTLMFRKFGEGGVVPKLHRIFRTAFNRTHVPQS